MRQDSEVGLLECDMLGKSTMELFCDKTCTRNYDKQWIEGFIKAGGLVSIVERIKYLPDSEKTLAMYLLYLGLTTPDYESPQDVWNVLKYSSLDGRVLSSVLESAIFVGSAVNRYANIVILWFLIDIFTVGYFDLKKVLSLEFTSKIIEKPFHVFVRLLDLNSSSIKDLDVQFLEQSGCCISFESIKVLYKVMDYCASSDEKLEFASCLIAHGILDTHFLKKGFKLKHYEVDFEKSMVLKFIDELQTFSKLLDKEVLPSSKSNVTPFNQEFFCLTYN